jgi:hypothetical protein
VKRVQCGNYGDIPIPEDIFGEGKARLAVFRPRDGYWYIKGSGFRSWASTRDKNFKIQFGKRGDIPLFVRI